MEKLDFLLEKCCQGHLDAFCVKILISVDLQILVEGTGYGVINRRGSKKR